MGYFRHGSIRIMDPITNGNYPKSMQILVGDRLPKFTESETQFVKRSMDLIGLNYHTATYADNLTSSSSSIDLLSYITDSHVNLTYEKNGIPIGQSVGPTLAGFTFIQKEFENSCFTKEKYNPPSIYITENGMGDVNSSFWPIDKALNDSLRIKYHSLHLFYLLIAIKDGLDVRGYHAWTFLDNFERSSGYTYQFGTLMWTINMALKTQLYGFKIFS
ncbi:hypothetical protein LWI28_003970 [Acer negundo]|uniref:Beta-glucosidase n=1 Tax=Acer negundo TaxID=4023 RepID=A0AAD5NMQ9_ACENE|nr:hypothetical protein LWI28_003970 [Acer negundo]